ncbi:MAG: hypothetical protein ACI97N_000414, partial [Cognaticolwellia sp.]
KLLLIAFCPITWVDKNIIAIPNMIPEFFILYLNKLLNIIIAYTISILLPIFKITDI